eukprot:g2020.t1
MEAVGCSSPTPFFPGLVLPCLARDRSELQEFQRRKVYQLVLVRVLFPNKMIFEVKCLPNETVKALYKKVAHVLRLDPDSDFYLYDTPPIRKLLSSSRKTLTQEGLAPGSNLHIGLHPESKKLQDYQREFLKKRDLPSVKKATPPQSSHQTVSQGPLPLDATFYLNDAWVTKLPPEPLDTNLLGMSGGSAASSSSSAPHWTPTAAHAERRTQALAAAEARVGAQASLRSAEPTGEAFPRPVGEGSSRAGGRSNNFGGGVTGGGGGQPMDTS